MWWQRVTADQPSTPDVASFFHCLDPPAGPDCCRGTACFVARRRDPARWTRAMTQHPPSYCLGRCYRAPASTEDGPVRPTIRAACPGPILLERVADGDHSELSTYARAGGYRALERALDLQPATLVDMIRRAGLRGRGGAAFSAGRKWEAVAAASGVTKWVVVNGDEGDPGAYSDRILLEQDPHAVLEGLLIASYAVGASHAVVYVRREYPEAAAAVRRAIDQARDARLLSSPLGAARHTLDVDVAIGHGSYVCGEETALLNALEGRRGEPRLRPPYPAAAGLFGVPTLVNNVETLANVPWIARHGASHYRRRGTSDSAGTKLVSLNSLFRRPGLYEVELGLPLRAVVDDLGHGLVDGRLTALWVGGPLSGVVPPQLLETPLAFDAMRAIGASVGHGGVVVIDEHTSIGELIEHVFEFGAFESCGLCTPCRLGTRRLASPGRLTRTEWTRLTTALRAASLCGFGNGLADFAASIERYYAEELDRCLA
ncbi:MAG: NADH-quinone oxidoreductase subunit D [Luteitalea sp.]|nr:NADH-quinone oxidoreductase subunit D [Luteitalea sp.]